MTQFRFSAASNLGIPEISDNNIKNSDKILETQRFMDNQESSLVEQEDIFE